MKKFEKENLKRLNSIKAISSFFHCLDKYSSILEVLTFNFFNGNPWISAQTLSNLTFIKPQTVNSQIRKLYESNIVETSKIRSNLVKNTESKNFFDNLLNEEDDKKPNREYIYFVTRLKSNLYSVNFSFNARQLNKLKSILFSYEENLEKPRKYFSKFEMKFNPEELELCKYLANPSNLQIISLLTNFDQIVLNNLYDYYAEMYSQKGSKKEYKNRSHFNNLIRCLNSLSDSSIIDEEYQSMPNLNKLAKYDRKEVYKKVKLNSKAFIVRLYTDKIYQIDPIFRNGEINN